MGLRKQGGSMQLQFEDLFRWTCVYLCLEGSSSSRAEEDQRLCRLSLRGNAQRRGDTSKTCAWSCCAGGELVSIVSLSQRCRVLANRAGNAITAKHAPLTYSAPVCKIIPQIGTLNAFIIYSFNNFF